MSEEAKPKKVDRRIIKTQKAIRDAFQSLLISKGIDKITVSALAREADIDRKTFYLHFASIDALIQQEASILVERVACALTASVHDDGDPVFLNMRNVLVALADVVNENERLYQHVISSLSMDQMVDTLICPVRRAVLESDRGQRLAGDPGLDYILRFYIAGTLSLFIEWFTNDRDKPIESIVDIVEKATRTGGKPLASTRADAACQATNDELTCAYLRIIEQAGGDIQGRRFANEYMRNSTAIVHHRVVDCSYLPRLFNQQTYDVMKRTAETAHRILCKVIERYLVDPQYRRVFDFDPRLEELILLPRGYDAVLPFARVDTFLDEDTYEMRFCEFNGDGSSGMNENREITNSIASSPAMRAFAADHEVAGCDLFEPWVDSFIEIYSTYEHAVENPRFAICDYLENGVVDEFHIFAELFRKRGFECVVRDVRELSFDGDELKDGEGKRIDAIWRRCVTNDVIDHWEDSLDLIGAVRAEKVALIGSFAGHIVHDKQIFEVLFAPETRAFLTDEEIAFVEQTVPLTTFLEDGAIDIDKVRASKDDWIIKPSDHYGSDNVYAGCEQTQEKWEELICAFANGKAGYPFIVQRYIKPHRTQTMPPDTGIDELSDEQIAFRTKSYNNLNGLYLYNGHFQGVFSRLGPNPTISKDNEGMTAATIWVDADVDCGIPLDVAACEHEGRACEQ